MGREIKRVPIDFDHPLKKPWTGYLFPEELSLPTCPACNGRGWSVMAQAMVDSFYYHEVGEAYWGNKLTQDDVDMLASEGRFRRVENPTAERVNAANTRGQTDFLGPLHHDAVNQWLLVKHRCARLGGNCDCPTCEGEGNVGTEEQRAAADAWERTEPPVGEGWQLWETVSEGSPISPVFDSPEGLAAWMSRNDCTVSGPVPYAEALKWATGPGWAPSMVGVGGQILDGIRGLEALRVDDEPLTAEDLEAIAEGERDLDEGRTVSLDDAFGPQS